MSEGEPDSDYEALMHVVHRLSERFPKLSEQEIRDATVDEFEKYEGARVRDFVPVLVERKVAERLRDARLMVDRTG